MKTENEFSSFRDPSGFIFYSDGELYRQINDCYKEHYDFFIKSGLYQELISSGMILPFNEVEQDRKDAYKIIKPKKIDFISYPYEWCFSQYKDAALLTLKIQKAALLKNMSLKDASAYNIQFVENKPVHIDTLSFEILNVKKPWKAYKQFCQHFLAPLALMSCVDPSLGMLMRNYIDGVPLRLASKLLPKFKNWGIITNIHLNALFSQKHESIDSNTVANIENMNLQKHLLLIDGLENTIKGLKLFSGETEWQEYYNNTNYNDTDFKKKEEIILEILGKMQAGSMLWDLGANNGHFTRIASKFGIKGFSFDNDYNAVEANYQHCKAYNEAYPFPLVVDLTNPSPAIGWNNWERKNLFERCRPDAIMALALIHHLVISNNLPFSYIASCFANLAPMLIMEYVGITDSQVQKLLKTRDKVVGYEQEHFEHEFLQYYNIVSKHKINNMDRTIYCFLRK